MSLIPSLIFPDQTFVAFVMSSMHAACSARPSLFDLVILTVLGEEPAYTIFSSSCFFCILSYPWCVVSNLVFAELQCLLPI